MKNLQNYNRGELAKEILIMISIGIIIPLSLVAPNLPSILKPILKSLPKNKKRPTVKNIVKSITYLKNQRLVDFKEKNGEQILTLSEEGKKRILKFNIGKLEIKKPRKWDGLWRVIIFDIPERQRQGRDILRSFLQRLGFYQLQKSCFVYPFECKDEVDFLTEIYNISQYINFIIAKHIEGESQLKKFFNIDG